jgi:hypothetical protein
MEKHWRRICNPAAKQVERNNTSSNITALDVLNGALANAESENLSSMAVQFDKICK